MTKYREIIQLAQPDLKLSQQKIAFSCGVSKKTVNKVRQREKYLMAAPGVLYGRFS